MFMPRVLAMRKVKVLTIAFSVFLIACAGSTKHAKSRSEPDGFRGIRWGTEISALGDMEKVEQEESSNNDLVWYKRKGDKLAIGKASLKGIFYGFWMGNFESVWIDFEGDDNFESLKKELFEQFGKVRESVKEFYAWGGKDTEMSLSYSRDRRNGILSIDSIKFSEERRAYDKQKEKEKREKEGGILKFKF